MVERRRRPDHSFVSKVVFFLSPHWIHARLTLKENLLLPMSNVAELL